MDPLTKGFPALTPYQYASNNPVEGVDLDGREYVSSKEVRIEVVWGKVVLKVENMHTVTKNILKEYHENTQNWPPHMIGADLSVGSIALKGMAPQQEADLSALDNTPGAPDPAFQAGKTEIENPKTKQSNYTVTDRRYKDRTVSSASPAGARGLAVASIAIDLTIMGTNLYIRNRIDDDQGMINKSLAAFKAAAADVNYALQKTNLIAPELQTTQYLSDIINVVLSGMSVVNDYDKKKGAQILEIGNKIYNTLSTKRLRTLGATQERSQMDNYSNRVQVQNPGYDPDYIKQNPPLE